MEEEGAGKELFFFRGRGEEGKRRGKSRSIFFDLLSILSRSMFP